ncbi:class I SAM-dependent methyltransferase [Sporolactobacillus sp. THM19-2]|uniref:class I SAM-dependent methyltransferase n=1 Tax=Sporolactobacillus sp. THM19-2 TaxID=2511171 RepID=UPI00101ED75A|nr:class I SAM-dependent methyltransferase [Sporolactobacillus sp. THM19-2]RYL92585.1 methyltransferase domain-containing protein [Sporolactobacillus sp. THM19-2]
MRNTEKFTGKAEVYAQFRPDYPETFVRDLILENHLSPSSVVADIGSGTGILTGQLLNQGLNVIAVEPNAEMRQIAESAFGSNPLFTSVPATAEQTTLKTGSVDLVTVAQAFHWFNPEQFKEECRRILKPDGKVALIWNSRVPHAPLIRETASVCRKFCPAFHGFSGGTSEDPAPFQTFFRNGRFAVRKYDHPLSYSLNAFLGRHLSASYAPKGQKGQPYIDALTQIFQKHQKRGRVRFPNVTCSYSGRV